MDNDDRQVGHVLGRREVLALLGVGGAAIVAGGRLLRTTGPVAAGIDSETATQAFAQPATASTCVVKPELTEGPYFVDEGINRSDIRIEQSDNSVKEGVPFELAFNVS